MATFSVIKLSGLTPIHIGTGRESYDFSAADLCSDTLSAALAATMAMWGEATDIQSFLGAIRLSSAFPYYKNHLFLPVPKGRINVEIKGEDASLYRKSLKKVRYIELPLWQQLINGEKLSIERNQINGEFIMVPSTQLPNSIYESEVKERVSVSRDESKDSEPFFFEWRFFDKDAGLFVLTESEGENLQKVVDLFEALGEQGIGTDKSVGGGKFEVSLDKTIEIGCTEEKHACMLLSLYLPTAEEMSTIDLEASRYSIILRGGYMAGSEKEEFRHLRKKSVYMMDVGSVLKTDTSLEGKVVDLRPEWNDNAMHPAFRSGRALSIPIKL